MLVRSLPRKTEKLTCDVFYTAVIPCGIVYDVTDKDCWSESKWYHSR